MRKLSFAALALAAFGVSVSARAADIGTYSKAPAYVAPVYNWTGFYIGGLAGGAFSGSNSFNGLVLSNYSAQFMVGAEAGVDYQIAPNLVAGIEGQYSWLGSNQISTVFPAGLSYNSNQRGLGSLTGRIGYNWGPVLTYVKGGYAYSSYDQSLTLGGAALPFTLNGSHHNGYTVGGGLEYMFAQNWSAKIEYQYYDFGSSQFITPALLMPFGSFRNDEHTVKAGVNYRINWGSPMVARY